jgi:hypothetical protein
MSSTPVDRGGGEVVLVNSPPRISLSRERKSDIATGATFGDGVLTKELFESPDNADVCEGGDELNGSSALSLANA